MSDLPPLPDTDDPHELLGVSRDADERALKKAYARLIKIYRPDRAPDDFDRIHAAFTAAKAGLFVAPALASPAPPPPPDLFTRLDADPSFLTSPELTYALLRPHLRHDPGAVSAVLLSRFESQLAERRFAEVAAALRDPDLRHDGDDHAAIAIPALRAIAALAWRSDDAPALLESWGQLPRELGVERLVDRVEGELALATRWKRALGAGALRDSPLRPAHVEELPPALIALVADDALASPRRRGAVFTELERLLERPARLLAVCDRIVAADPGLAHLLAHRFVGETPGGARNLARLAHPVFDAVGAALVALERALHAPVRPWMLAAGAIGGVAAAAVAAVPVAIGAGVALGSAGVGGVRISLARRRYLQKVRPGLAAIVCAHGVQADVLREWLTYNRRLAGDLATFDITVAADEGLALLGAVAALVRETARRAAAPDDDTDASDDDDPDDE